MVENPHEIIYGYGPMNAPNRLKGVNAKRHTYTHGCKSLTTLLVKYYNDLLGRQSSERGRDKVTYYSVGDLFCTHLGTKYANFQEKIFAEVSGKKFRQFFQKSPQRFFLENWNT